MPSEAEAGPTFFQLSTWRVRVIQESQSASLSACFASLVTPKTEYNGEGGGGVGIKCAMALVHTGMYSFL